MRTVADTVWLTGLLGSARRRLRLRSKGSSCALERPVRVLDGDALRTGLSNDLELSRADLPERAGQARRARDVSESKCSSADEQQELAADMTALAQPVGLADLLQRERLRHRMREPAGFNQLAYSLRACTARSEPIPPLDRAPVSWAPA
jgi:hypothetical protein